MRSRDLNTIKTIGVRKHSGVPIWKPWFDDMESPYDLGVYHGKDDRQRGLDEHLHSGCLMTTEEHDDYREGYEAGYASEHGMEEL